eukprot:9248615-Pyramimonas_sp.AAC.1
MDRSPLPQYALSSSGLWGAHESHAPEALDGTAPRKTVSLKWGGEAGPSTLPGGSHGKTLKHSPGTRGTPP